MNDLRGIHVGCLIFGELWIENQAGTGTIKRHKTGRVEYTRKKKRNRANGRDGRGNREKGRKGCYFDFSSTGAVMEGEEKVTGRRMTGIARKNKHGNDVEKREIEGL